MQAVISNTDLHITQGPMEHLAAGAGSATLSMAAAGAQFAERVLAGLAGKSVTKELAFVEVGDAKAFGGCTFFATEVDLGKLMAAGFLPGILTVALYLAVIAVVVQIWPHIGPAGDSTGWPARLRALRDVWVMVLLFVVVLGGIYVGIFTPTEAAGVGAFGAFLITLSRRRLYFPAFVATLVETVRATASLFVVLIGALVFANFITIAGAATALEQWVSGMNLTPTMLILVILAIYIVLGCILEATAMMLLTIPIFFPIILIAGIDPIWFGIFVVIMGGVAAIHPPLGMLLFVIRTLVPDIRTNTIFLGVLPYGDGSRTKA